MTCGTAATTTRRRRRIIMVMMVECSAMNNEIHPPSVPHPHHTSHIMQSSYTHAERAQRQSRRNWHLHVAIRYHRVCIFGGRRNDSTPAISRAYTWQIDLEQNDLSLGNDLERRTISASTPRGKPDLPRGRSVASHSLPTFTNEA